jgi:hypothetical protein
VLRADVSIDGRALAALLSAEYGADASVEPAFVPVGGDSWCFRAGDRWVSVRRDRSGHRPAAYEAARALADDGADFVLAPLRGAGGHVVHVVGERPVVVFPYIEARPAPRDRMREVLDVVVELHARSTRVPLERETYELFFVDELDRGLAAVDAAVDAGPFSAPTIALVTRRRADIEAARSRLAQLQASCRALGDADFALTHGEPDSNTLETTDGRLLLGDVGTLLLGPRERDLAWLLDAVDPAIIRAEAIAFYRRSFALAEVAEYVARFMAPHPGDGADQDRWSWLTHFIDRLDGR